MKYLDKLKQFSKYNEASQTLHDFYFTYVDAAKSNKVPESIYEPILLKFLELIYDEFKNPYEFEPFHIAIRSPFDYYRFGIDFIRPLVVNDKSTILHPENLDKIQHQLSQNHNVILLANHQTELDPQAFSILLEKNHPQIAEQLIVVAGHRVTTDPMAIPFSKGCNLLCINSKKYIQEDPTKKEEKLLHNQKTMLKMSQLLAEGGKCIWVAPSGGRDRLSRNQEITLAPFDPQSIELFWLMAQRANIPTHFYPLAMHTYYLLPPPQEAHKKLGEKRETSATPIHLAFGSEVNMEADFPGDKKQKRKERANFIFHQVNKLYHQFPKE